MNFFHHKDLGNHILQLCPKVVKHPVYQMMYWYNWFSWWWALGCSKHVEKWNKRIKKCLKLVINMNCTERHGHQTITKAVLGLTHSPIKKEPGTLSPTSHRPEGRGGVKNEWSYFATHSVASSRVQRQVKVL